jgi:hypothetical protein
MLGDTPDVLPSEEVLAHGGCVTVTATNALIIIDGVARYLIRAGSEIIVTPDPLSDEDSVRLFLLTTALGIALHQRATFTLSGAAISAPFGGVLLAGTSGIGTSTLATALYLRGYTLISDEFCVATVTPGGTPLLQPGIPRVMLWGYALEQLDNPFPHIFPVRRGMEKYSILLHDSFSTTPLPLWRIYWLIPTNALKVKFAEVRGCKQLSYIYGSSYCKLLSRTAENKRSRFHWSLRMAQFVHIRQMERPHLIKPDEMADALIEDFTR